MPRSTRSIAALLLVLAGCNRNFTQSECGLDSVAGDYQDADPRVVGDWYDREWQRVEWKIERLPGSKKYFVTHLGPNDDRTFYTASLLRIGDLRLLDLSAPSTTAEAGPKPNDHLIVRFTLNNPIEIILGTVPPEKARKVEAFGNRRVMRYKEIKLAGMRNRYFLDHPDVLSYRKHVDSEGRDLGIILTARPGELLEFFRSHGDDDGLWAEDNEMRMESK